MALLDELRRAKQKRTTNDTADLLPDQPLISSEVAGDIAAPALAPAATPEPETEPPAIKFTEAFATARAAGEKVFSWEGSEYTTQLKAEAAPKDEAPAPAPVEAAAPAAPVNGAVTADNVGSLLGNPKAGPAGLSPVAQLKDEFKTPVQKAEEAAAAVQVPSMNGDFNKASKQLRKDQEAAGLKARLARRERELRTQAPVSTVSATPQPEGNLDNAMSGLVVNTSVGLDRAKINAQAWMSDALDKALGRAPSAEGAALQQDRLRKYDQVQGRAAAAKPAFNLELTNDLYDAYTSFAQTAPSLAVGLLTKNPALALGLAGAQAADYLKYKKRGATTAEASLGALGESAVEVITEVAPMGYLLKKFGKEGAAEFIGGYFVREMGGEQAATLAQDAIDTAIANPDKTWGQYLDERPAAAYHTALAVLVTGGVVGSANTVVNGVASIPGRVQEAQATRAADAAKANALSQWHKAFNPAAREAAPAIVPHVGNTATPGRTPSTDAILDAAISNAITQQQAAVQPALPVEQTLDPEAQLPAQDPMGRVDPTLQPEAPLQDKAGVIEQAPIDNTQAIEPVQEQPTFTAPEQAPVDNTPLAPEAGRVEPTPALQPEETPLDPAVQRAVETIDALEAGGVSINMPKINAIARDLGLEVRADAQPEETVAQIRAAVGMDPLVVADEVAVDAPQTPLMLTDAPQTFAPVASDTPARLFGMSGAQLEAMQGGKLTGKDQFPGVAPTQEAVEARKQAVSDSKVAEKTAVDSASAADPRIAALKDAGLPASQILQAANELKGGDDSLVNDLARIGNIKLPAAQPQVADTAQAPKGGTPLTEQQEHRLSLRANAEELAMQIAFDSAEPDFDPADAEAAIGFWAKDKFTEAELRTALIAAIEARKNFRRKAGVLSALRNATAAQPAPAEGVVSEVRALKASSVTKRKAKAIPSALATKDPAEYAKAAKDALLKLLKKHGLSSKDARDLTGENAFKANQQNPGMFKGKTTLDVDIIPALVSNGYMTQQQVDEDVQGGMGVAMDLIREAFTGNTGFVGTFDQQERMAELEALEADLAAELSPAEISLAEDIAEDEASLPDYNSIATADSADDMRASGMFTEDEINETVNREKTESPAAREAQEGDRTGEGQDPNQKAEARPELSLAGQTPAELKAKAEAEQKAAEKAERDASKPTGPKVTADQVDMFNTQGGLFSGNRDDGDATNPNMVAEPQKLDYDSLYDNLETRPDTRPEQLDLGRSALLAAERRIFGSTDGVRRLGATLLGSSISRDFRADGGTSLVGKQLSADADARAYDLATLAQVLRDPRFETLRVFYTAGGEIVGEAAYSSRLPAAAYFPPDIDARVKSDMDRFVADGYWVMHNHPSGSATESQDDLRLTEGIAARVPGFEGHVIIDNDEFNHISLKPNGVAEGQVIPAPGLARIDLRANHEVPHPILGKAISSPLAFAQLAKQLQQKDGYITLIGTDSQQRVTLVTEVPKQALAMVHPGRESQLRLLARVKRATRETGSRLLFAVVPGKLSDYPTLVDSNIFIDVVDSTGLSAAGYAGSHELPRTRAEKRGGKINAREPEAENYGAPDVLVSNNKEDVKHGQAETAGSDQQHLNKLAQQYADAAAAPDASERVKREAAAVAGITVVDPQSVRDTNAAGHLGRGDVAFLEKLGDLSGIKFVYVHAPNMGAEQFTLPAVGKTVYVDVSQPPQTAPAVTGGHEVFHIAMHTLRAAADPESRAVAATVDGLLEDNLSGMALARFQNYYNQPGLDAQRLREEAGADIGGNLHADPAFWERVLDAIDAKHGATGVRKFIDAMKQSLKKLTALVQGRTFQEGYVTNAEAVREAVAQALIRYYTHHGAGADMAKTKANLTLGVAAVNLKASSSRTSQTESAAFKNWFGDSKVVDADGKPLVVYHGTWANDFKAFGGVNYFTADPAYAGIFAGDSNGSRLMPVYLGLQQPLDATSLGSGDLTLDRLLSFFEKNGVELPAAFKRRITEDFRPNNLPPFWELFGTSRGITADIAKAGFDGLILKENVGKHVTTAYVNFRPEQIKSAIGNNGDFDATNPNILKSPPRKGDKTREQLAADHARMIGQDNEAVVDYIEQVLNRAADDGTSHTRDPVSHATTDEAAEHWAHRMGWSVEVATEVLNKGVMVDGEMVPASQLLGAAAMTTELAVADLLKNPDGADFSKRMAETINLMITTRAHLGEAGRTLNFARELQKRVGRNGAQDKIDAADLVTRARQNAEDTVGASSDKSAEGQADVAAYNAEQGKLADVRDAAGQANADAAKVQAELDGVRQQVRDARAERDAAKKLLSESNAELKKAEAQRDGAVDRTPSPFSITQAEGEARHAMKEAEAARDWEKLVQERLKAAQDRLVRATEQLQKAKDNAVDPAELKRMEQKARMAEAEANLATSALKEAQRKLREAANRLRKAQDKEALARGITPSPYDISQAQGAARRAEQAADKAIADLRVAQRELAKARARLSAAIRRKEEQEARLRGVEVRLAAMKKPQFIGKGGVSDAEIAAYIGGKNGMKRFEAALRAHPDIDLGQVNQYLQGVANTLYSRALDAKSRRGLWAAHHSFMSAWLEQFRALNLTGIFTFTVNALGVTYMAADMLVTRPIEELYQHGPKGVARHYRIANQALLRTLADLKAVFRFGITQEFPAAHFEALARARPGTRQDLLDLQGNHWMDNHGGAIGGAAVENLLNGVGAPKAWADAAKSAGDNYGKAVRAAGFSPLGAVDMLVKIAPYRYALAMQQAKNPGKPVDYKAALEFAEYGAFQQRLGKMMSTLPRWVAAIPHLGFLAPYITALVNLTKIAATLDPVLSTAMHADDMLGFNGKVLQARGFSRVTVALLLFAVTMALYGDGEDDEDNILTGPGPLDYNKKKLWEAAYGAPLSLKIGDSSTSLQRMEPFAGAMTLHIAELNAFDQLTEGEITAAIGTLLTAWGQLIIGKNFMKTTADAAAAITDRGEAEDSEDGSTRATKFAKRQATSIIAATLIPGFFAQAGDVSDVHLRDASSGAFEDAFKRRLPYAREDLDPRLGYDGEPLPNLRYGTLLPINPEPRHYDPTAAAMLRNDVPLTAMPKGLEYGVDGTRLPLELRQMVLQRRKARLDQATARNPGLGDPPTGETKEDRDAYRQIEKILKDRARKAAAPAKSEATKLTNRLRRAYGIDDE